MVEAARAEAEDVVSRASAEAAQTAESARAAANELLAKAGVEARDISDTARMEAEQLLSAAHAGGTAPVVESKPKAVQPEEAQPEEPESPAEVEAGFTPPPSSLEDLAAASRPKRFSFKNQ
jgi:cell division septum initiation protein DivIVA